MRGKLVLTSSQPGAAYELAVDRFGAAGIVSYAQNQVTGWWKEDETLVRWGHLDTFPAPKTFAFMVSLKQARAWQERLAAGQPVRLRASVRAGQHPGAYSIATAVIPGADREHEVVLSCHLDHQRPGGERQRQRLRLRSWRRGARWRSWSARGSSRRRGGRSASSGRRRSRARPRCSTPGRTSRPGPSP